MKNSFLKFTKDFAYEKSNFQIFIRIGKRFVREILLQMCKLEIYKERNSSLNKKSTFKSSSRIYKQIVREKVYPELH